MPRKVWLGLIPMAGLFLHQFFQFDVLQDDAFISFRYIRNFLDGHGLVFNIGERVEGYTNFFWIILLAPLSKLGLPLVETARVLGIVAGIGTLGVSAYAAHKMYPKRNWLWVLSVALLLAANGSFAYWSGSGLETGLFTLLATAAAATYSTNAPLSMLFVTLAALTRPEGALLAFLFGVTGMVLKLKSGRQTLLYWGILAAAMIPYAAFKLFYYGSLLPNPFYAKTGFSAEYWQSGLEYAGLFFKHYGLHGAALLLPLVFWRKLATFSRFSLILFLGYTLYVVAVGGDVLKAHRFFVPVLIFLFFPAADGLFQMFQKWRAGQIPFLLSVLLLGFWFRQNPGPYLKNSAKAERGLVTRMANAGRYFDRHFPGQSVAISTLGAFSHYGARLKVIDMLGLTEPEVARNPEGIEGIESSWKERRFDAGYVLSLKPDFIQFSTGLKPSAPAERALFLYPDFRRNYRSEFSYHEEIFGMFYRRFQNLPGGNRPDLPALVVNEFNEGLNRVFSGNYGEAIARLKKALAASGGDCAAFYTALGYAYFSAGYPDSTERYLLKGMELDGGGSISRYYYRNYLRSQKRFEEAAIQDSVLIQTVPNAAEFLARQKPFDNP